MNAARMETPVTGSSIAEYSPTAIALAELRNKYEAVVYDVTDSKGMVAAKAARAELRGYRVALEKTRVEIKAPALQRSRDIDSEAKRITAEIEALEDPISGQIKAEEDRKAHEKAEAERIERERVEAINARFDALKALPLQAATATADECRAMIAQAEAFDPASFPADLLQAAKFEQRMAITGLRAALDRIEQADADRAELERLREAAEAVRIEGERLAQAERDREEAEQRRADAQAQAEREQAIREEAVENAKRDAAAALERAEQDRIDDARRADAAQAEAVRQAEARAAQQAEARERARLAVIAEQEEADAKRAANRAHVGRVNSAALAALVTAGLSEADARTAITAIAKGEIPAVSIAY